MSIKSKFLVLTCLTLASTLAHAKPRKKTSKVNVPEMKLEGSQAVRSNKIFGLSLGGSMLSTSIQGSYLINKQLQANLSYVKSEIPFLGETATVENSEESNTMSEEILSKIVGNKVETNMKFFLGNSFYVEPGLFRETFSGENSEAYSMYDNEYKIESTTY